MATRTARTSWDGGLQDGSGEVELSSSGLGTFDMSFPKRSSDTAGGTTSPEELIAAAHSACYSMQLSALLGERGATPLNLETSADVTLGRDPAGGFRITTIALRVRGEVEGIDENGFLEAAEEAKETCPVSKALEGVDEMTVDAALETT
ncbi:OsmC family peroxiredoxin [uncultured Aeromicrobium sp.]|uniref:OsmC family peroxiredoxin n=1 Tax=uncultured Aeromicrobium sp. TaxID=337820 RepID=UPI0025E52E83|nr:OsmC family peroxiredoxin [uncultured Aeromicrobium sp.]